MSGNFASSGDLGEKKITFKPLGENVYGFTAEGDPNSGVIVGDDCCMVIDAQATPKLARKVIAEIEKVTNKPVKYVVLTHYHAVRVLGANAYGEGVEIITSDATRSMIVERGRQDWDSEFGRFPRLFEGHEEITGLTWPTTTFDKKLSIYLGKREVQLRFIGRGHTMGDIVAYVPDCGAVFAGDLVEYGATPYTGDAHFTDWPTTLDQFKEFDIKSLVPGRGEALIGDADVGKAIADTRDFLETLYGNVQECVAQGKSLNETFKITKTALTPKFGHWVIFDHCLPFDITRAFDEAGGLDHPRIWTDERDQEMWVKLA